MESRVIELTPAAHRHGNLNLRVCGRDFFPADIYGASTREGGLGRQVLLRPDGLPDPVVTDIPTDKDSGRPRWIFRQRKWLKEFLRYHNLAPRDKITICRLDELTYFVAPTKRIRPTLLFERTLPPVLYAQKLADDYLNSSNPEHRKERGQYFTPPEIASFMARLATNEMPLPARILDPGAGTGILSCAVCEQVVERFGAKKIHVTAYESDPDLRDLLYKSMLHASKWAQDHTAKLTFQIYDIDFLASGLWSVKTANSKPYDLVISNPPYTKISANDPRAQALAHVVYGQPNLYALFMAASIPLLKKHGSLVFITPRSYAAGHYFKAFREVFFSQMQPVRVHVFDSRSEVFSNQEVLQENIVLKAVKAKVHPSLVISNSKNGRDLDSARQNPVPLSYALHRDNGHFVFRLPLDDFDDTVTEIVDSWKSRLADYGFQISTGPVVPFRTKQFLSTKQHRANKVYVPLLWMSNVRPMHTVWPSDGVQTRDAAQQLIEDCPRTRKAKLVLRNKNMVLLRRFSAKEEKRRLTASPLFSNQFKSGFLGIENHVNYIHRPGADMTSDEIRGLAALLNSALLDRYFRICSGNTQVGAIELRHMPLPPIESISELGRKIQHCDYRFVLQRIDACVWRIASAYTTRKQSLRRFINCDA